MLAVYFLPGFETAEGAFGGGFFGGGLCATPPFLTVSVADCFPPGRFGLSVTAVLPPGESECCIVHRWPVIAKIVNGV